LSSNALRRRAFSRLRPSRAVRMLRHLRPWHARHLAQLRRLDAVVATLTTTIALRRVAARRFVVVSFVPSPQSR